MTYNGMLPFFPANLLQIPHEERHHQPTKPQDFRGMEAVLGKRPMSFTGIEACEVLNMEDKVSDNGLQPAGEKKKRLNLEQIRTLEKNFDMGSKLEPERKMELARTLGLHPRQITIWFQNRRARWKTKQLEKDYDELKKQFEIIKAENDALLAQNKNLLSELWALKGKETSEPIINLNKETVGSCSIRSESSSDVNLDISRASINDSCSDPHHSRTFFPSYRTPGVPQLIHRSSSETHKADNSIQEGNFCNVYCSTDEQSAFWAWSEQHKFHH